MSTSKTKKAGKSLAKQQKTIVRSTQSQSEVKPGLKSWLKAFYRPVTKASTWSDKKCFEHTLKKYEGTLPKVLTKYKLRRVAASLADDSHDLFPFNHGSCSLCEKYYRHHGGNPCRGCPIEINGVKCAVGSDPYSVFAKRGNPKPMIKLMKELISQCDKRGRWVGLDD